MPIEHQKTCPYVDIPQKYVGYILDTDLFIMVTAKSEPDQSFVAWAIPCALSSNTARPNIGHINFNLAYLDLALNKFQGNVETTLHELNHVLGFNAALFSQFRDENL